MTTVGAYEEAVRFGIEFLDRTKPGWAGDVDLETLDLIDPQKCVLAQVFGDYFDAVNEYDIGIPHEMGFDLDPFGTNGNTVAHAKFLTSMWRVEIRTRQGYEAR